MSDIQDSPIVVVGDHDDRTVEQLVRCVRATDGARGALCADGHVGYSQPIGGVVAYTEHISPSGVGYDIGCGNTAIRLDLNAEDIRADMRAIMDQVCATVSFGVGRQANTQVDHAVLEAIAQSPVGGQRQMTDLAAKQLSTVGSGNHYVDIFSDEDGQVWVGVHFGSRGFGHRTASGFLALAEGKRFTDRATDGEMDGPPVLFHVDSQLGQDYIAAMTLAGDYARAGRQIVCDQVRRILGADVIDTVENHHNYAWKEEHNGQSMWVVRKGATPAWPGQRGFVGASMGEDAVIIEGVDGAQAASLMYSTVHGAGRAMSRTKAAGKVRSVRSCGVRDCDFWMSGRQYQAALKEGSTPHCSEHPDARLNKSMRQVTPGAIDYTKVTDELARKGIELRGGGADEAPAAYKRLDQVLDWHSTSVRILHRLTPMGVAMAGPGVVDPYKD